MKATIFVSIAALCLAVMSTSDVQADQPQATTCNVVLAQGLEATQQIVKQGDLVQCGDFTNSFFEFALEGCFDLFGAQELEGLGGSAVLHPETGELKNLGVTICDAVDICGLCGPALLAGVCVEPCS